MSDLPAEVWQTIVQFQRHDRDSLRRTRLLSRTAAAVTTPCLFETIYLRPNLLSFRRADDIANTPGLRDHVLHIELVRELVHECGRAIEFAHANLLARHIDQTDHRIRDGLTVCRCIRCFEELIQAQETFRELVEFDCLRDLLRCLPRLQRVVRSHVSGAEDCDDEELLTLINTGVEPRRVGEICRSNKFRERFPVIPSVLETVYDRNLVRHSGSFSLSTIFRLCADMSLRALQILSTGFLEIHMLGPPYLHQLKVLSLDVPFYFDESRLRTSTIQGRFHSFVFSVSGVEELSLRVRHTQFSQVRQTWILQEWWQIIIQHRWPNLECLHLTGLIGTERNLTHFFSTLCPKLRVLSINGLMLQNEPSHDATSMVRFFWQLGQRKPLLQEFKVAGLIQDNGWMLWKINRSKGDRGSLLSRLERYILGHDTFPFPSPQDDQFKEAHEQFLKGCLDDESVNMSKSIKDLPDSSFVWGQRSFREASLPLTTLYSKDLNPSRTIMIATSFHQVLKITALQTSAVALKIKTELPAQIYHVCHVPVCGQPDEASNPKTSAMRPSGTGVAAL